MADFQWHPTALFKPSLGGDKGAEALAKFALIILNQPIDDSHNLDTLWKNGRDFDFKKYI